MNKKYIENEYEKIIIKMSFFNKPLLQFPVSKKNYDTIKRTTVLLQFSNRKTDGF